MRHLYRYILSSHYSDYSYAYEPIDFFSVLNIYILTISVVLESTGMFCRFDVPATFPRKTRSTVQ